MCDFVSISVPKSATERMSKWRRRYFALSPHDNPTLESQLPAGYSTWVLTTGGCSCDLCVSAGSVPHQGSTTPDLTLRDDAMEIIAEIAAGLDRVFLYVHQYSGDVSTERLAIVSKERRKIDAFGSQSSFRRDSLIELTTR